MTRSIFNAVITHFWVTPKFFLFYSKKKTARCRFERHRATSSSLCMQRQGRRRFLKMFIPLTFSPFHLHKTLPKPIPSLMKKQETHTPHHDEKKAMPCSGCTGAIPSHHALHLDRVWCLSPGCL